MRFAFDDEQLAFRDAVASFLRDRCTPAVVRTAWENEDGRIDELWDGLAEMGVLGLTVPEAHGGLGLGPLDWVLLFEETGRVALAEPVVDTVAVAAPLLAETASGGLAAEWLPRVAAGDATIAVGFVGTPFVSHADSAQLVILERGDRLVAVPGLALTLERQPSVDGARRLFSVDWTRADETVLVEGPDGWHAVNAAFDRGALATSAQLLGLAQTMLDMTVAYVTERKQFGVPIGSFQAVKHHLADAALRLAFARPVVHHAAYALAHGLETHARDVSAAKAAASDAAGVVGRAALQCHGAIGYTVEYDLHLYLKRSWALAASWGDARWHRNRVARTLLDPAPSPPPAGSGHTRPHQRGV